MTLMGTHHDRQAVWRDRCANLDFDSISSPDSQGLHRKRRRSEKHIGNWRDHRLCGQVRRALQMGLADCGDPDLQSLIVLRVEPTGQTSNLCIHLLTPGNNTHGLEAKIVAVTGRLRHEVAQNIHRKKTPQLLFQLHTPESHHEH